MSYVFTIIYMKNTKLLCSVFPIKVSIMLIYLH